MYSPTLGRWTQSDPIEYEAGDPNLYRFVGNDPGNRLDPMGLVSVTSKSVPWPQTGFHEGAFYFYWGVALYIDDAGLKELANATPSGGYIVSKRTITWKVGNNPEKTATAWHLNQITVQDGHLVPNNDYTMNSEGKGGPRSMDDGSTALTYFSVINVPFQAGMEKGYTEATGKVTVALTWKLYKCAPSAATNNKFPEVGIDPSNIGWDEYVHARWTSSDPGIAAKPVAEGTFDATVTWAAPDKHTFSSSNKDISSGPNRKNRRHFFSGWDHRDGKWTPR